jgi:hypothetical protein
MKSVSLIVPRATTLFVLLTIRSWQQVPGRTYKLIFLQLCHFCDGDSKNNPSVVMYVSSQKWWQQYPILEGMLESVLQCPSTTVFARSNSEVVRSNSTRGMVVCVSLFCVCVVLCVGKGLATGWSPVKGVLSSLYRIKILKKLPRYKGL